MPFKDLAFGGVFLLFTLCFVENAKRVLSEAERVLKKGGGLIVGIINRESQWGHLYIRKKAEGHPLYKYAHFYSVGEVARMIEKTGMAVTAYSSTLCQQPSEKPYRESVYDRLIEGAGFVCVRAMKPL